MPSLTSVFPWLSSICLMRSSFIRIRSTSELTRMLRQASP